MVRSRIPEDINRAAGDAIVELVDRLVPLLGGSFHEIILYGTSARGGGPSDVVDVNVALIIDATGYAWRRQVYDLVASIGQRHGVLLAPKLIEHGQLERMRARGDSFAVEIERYGVSLWTRGALDGPADKAALGVAGTNTAVAARLGEVIVCVDDEPLVLRVLSRTLERKLGRRYAIETAKNGAEACALIVKLSREPTRLRMVVSDAMMPIMDGYALVEWLHRTMPHVPKIMVTGNGQEERIEQLQREAGLLAVFAKPWDERSLVRFIERVLAEPA